MKLEFIERLIDIAERSQLAELEYSEGDCRVRIDRRLAAPIEQLKPAEPRPVSTNSVESAATTAPASGHAVTSSLVGLFYRAPAPDKPPFVQVGDLIEEGQTLAIVEAMKMLNPIEADCAGRVIAIVPGDGEMVEFGSPLFIIDVAG
ncbi:acetyl-CoA carboxylase biotin carboxyl carrier protein [Pseudomonas sp. R5(2019)]|uniref:acetyl-CoA carboxylase biotin carboxyl carrier protein n=1 Tax=Pseudomonas sp. R5(2019) TaxID=2697566 RepID=UPI001412AB77|nr:acetyl-CoA carboxylase biotin carboxyl carrier protein [Pseudomonas sp. R5(2019)]NBA94870.1 acetyl-CoA carboxylase biotin carboxyl carrier protein [Pseudomonas sp. R5(2019)]